MSFKLSPAATGRASNRPGMFVRIEDHTPLPISLIVMLISSQRSLLSLPFVRISFYSPDSPLRETARREPHIDGDEPQSATETLRRTTSCLISSAAIVLEFSRGI